MCDKEACPPIGDGTPYCPLRRYKNDAFSIMTGDADPIAARNLLAAIECGDVFADMLPVALEEIERVAGRKLSALIGGVSPSLKADAIVWAK